MDAYAYQLSTFGGGSEGEATTRGSVQWFGQNELALVGDHRRYRLDRRELTCILVPVDEKEDDQGQYRLYQEPLPDRRIKPQASWLKPGGVLTVCGVRPGLPLRQVEAMWGPPNQKLPNDARGYAKSDSSTPLFEVVPDKHDPYLEQDGRMLLNSESTVEDLQTIFGRLPEPTQTEYWKKSYSFPVLKLSVFVWSIPVQDRMSTSCRSGTVAEVSLTL